ANLDPAGIDDVYAALRDVVARGDRTVVLVEHNLDQAVALATRVVALDRIRKKVTDEAGVLERFGVRPASIPDLLALVGDDADGIPGVPRWGAKSAATLLAHYGSLEAIPDDAAAWQVPVRGAAALAQQLRQHRDDARLYKALATLRTDVPLAEDVGALEWRGARRRELADFCAATGDANFPDRVKRWRD
ncbi:MAG: 5'-3' exonuclease H3TH domain-containing protein, partial [Gemmatimonadota bacterium]